MKKGRPEGKKTRKSESDTGDETKFTWLSSDNPAEDGQSAPGDSEVGGVTLSVSAWLFVFCCFESSVVSCVFDLSGRLWV